ncbi:uncharacterized protein LOC131217046 [Magnolia sinica]|uniref:uncharacterized protein LOC131217046 n=1 Tax=Magnolia sinica TaxID=86752 RepID=UPI002658C44D|nr:uncharacterized protein LOC131217046 [Magnolia sinica]
MAASTFNISLFSTLSKPSLPFNPSLKTLKPHFHTKPNFPNPLRIQSPPFNPCSPKSSPTDLLPSDPTTSSLPQTLKTRLSSGETLYGIFLLGFSPTLAEIAGHAGYDFAVVDMEHGPGGISDALACLRALAATQTPAILRIPESSDVWAKKALDLGPQGIMFPMIDGPKSAKKAVSYCRFPPEGVRGSAHTVVRASKYGIDDGYLQNYQDELLIMCQVETEEAVKKIEEIAAVDGVDCIQMGPLDLSASLGYLWDPGHKKVREVLHGAEKKVLKTKGAFLAGFAMAHDSPEELRVRGYHMVSGAVDLGLFRAAAVDDVARFKKGLKEAQKEEDKDEKYWSE